MAEMKPLSKEDRSYLATHAWPHMWNRRLKSYEEFEPAEGRVEELDAFERVDTQFFLYRDSHNVSVRVCVYRETPGEGSFLGFLWGDNSEEAFFDPDEFGPCCGPFEVLRYEETRAVYSRADGEEWQR